MIESRIFSAFNYELMDEMGPALAEKVKATGAQCILLDFRKSHMDMSTLEIFGIPKRLAGIFTQHGVDIRQVKRAILIATDDKDFDFLDDVTNNSGQTFKHFYDRRSALAWLTAE